MSRATSGEWFDKSWNPISGRCPNRCVDLNGREYCWMWRPGDGIANRFKEAHDHPLRLDEKVLNHPPKSGRVFVGSSTDMWADEVSDLWIYEVFRKIYLSQAYGEKALFFFLTKNAFRYFRVSRYMQLPSLAWYGTTWDGTPKTRYNITDLQRLCEINANGSLFFHKKLISFEPLLTDPSGLDLSDILWIIIGADSRRGKPKPPKEWADYLIQEARRVGAMVLVKDNYNYPERIKEMP